MLITPSALSVLGNQYRFEYQTAFEATPSIVGDQLATTIPSASEQNVYAWLETLPKFREWIGERTVRNLVARNFSVPNKDFELTVEVPRNKIEDDQYGLYSPMFAMMGRSAKLWRDELLLDALFNGAVATSLCYDGQPFFNANHPVNAEDPATAVQSNINSLAFSAASLITVRTAMRSLTGRDGRNLGILSGKPMLVVVPALEATARNLLNDEFIAPTGAVNGNAASIMQTNPLRGSFDLVVVPDTRSSTAWWVLDQGFGIKPLIFQERLAPYWVRRVTENDESVFQRNVFQYGARARGAATYGLWWLAARGNA